MVTLATSADLAGTIYSSGVNSPNHMANEGWKTFFDPLLGDAIDELNSPQTGLSSSSVTFGTGAKTFVTNTTLRLYPGGYAVAARVSDPTSAWMFGSVTAKSGTTVIMDVTRLSSGLASGPYTNWALSLAAPEPVVASAVTSVSLVASSAGITVASGLGLTDVGTMALALADDMAAVEALTSTGVLDRLGTASFQILSKGSAIQTVILASSEQAIASVFEARPTTANTIISETTTWSKPVTGTMIFVEAWGGGGGGATVVLSTDNQAGGGGGAYVFAKFNFTDIATTVLIAIGSGGLAGTINSVYGLDGLNTSFGAYLTAYGGAGARIGGGGGGGALSAGSNTLGGAPHNNVASETTQDGFGGGSTITSSAGHTGFGGAAGGNNGGPAVAGNAVFGGAGGGYSTSSGVSIFGGNGGRSGLAGTPPGGGGGGGVFQVSSGVAGNGARGEVRIWVI